MFRLLDKISFCIFFRTSFDRSLPNKPLILVLTSFEYPPRTSSYYDVYLLYFIAWILLFQFPPKWCILPCLLFFLCSSICYPRAAHLQQKNLLSYTLFTIRASILLALSSVFSTKTGTSQDAVMELFSVIGLGSLGEYQGGIDSARSYM